MTRKMLIGEKTEGVNTGLEANGSLDLGTLKSFGTKIVLERL